MPLGGPFARCVAVIGFAGLGLNGAAAQDEERYSCLQYDQVEAIHRLSESDILLEVEGGTTIYHLTVEQRCLRGDYDNDIMIEGSGEDGCMRVTDRVHYGRRECGIEDVELIETQEQLDALLAE